MRKITEVLRLYHEARLSLRQIAASLRLSRDTVSRTLERATMAGVGWPLPEGLDEAALERLLYPPESIYEGKKRPVPDWSEVHRQLKRKGVTLQLVWQEYKSAHPDGFQYSWYCDLYRAWLKKVDVVMRHHHRAGEKLFVDYAGQTVPITDPVTGELREAQVFVAVLGASNYTYAEATWSQNLRDWIGAHVRALTFFGGVPEIIVPDNLRSGVAKAHRYEPELNPTYADLAAHYSVAVVPARSGKPRDKAKVEVGVQVVERWILARLRGRSFFSLAELNDAIQMLLEELNSKPFQKLPGSRRSTFEEMERKALRPLPLLPYAFAEWKKARVNIDYHVEVDGHYYSVPYNYARAAVDVRLTEMTIECFCRGRRIASHARSVRRGHHTTVKEHMPKAHQQYAEWTPERLVSWAGKTGPATAELVRQILVSRPHVQQGYRSALGILRLGKAYGDERLEAASRRALAIGASSYKSVESILKHGLENRPLQPDTHSTRPIAHDNIRGALYFGPGLGPDTSQTEYKC
jgi:transposase